MKHSVNARDWSRFRFPAAMLVGSFAFFECTSLMSISLQAATNIYDPRFRVVLDVDVDLTPCRRSNWRIRIPSMQELEVDLAPCRQSNRRLRIPWMHEVEEGIDSNRQVDRGLRI